MAYWPIIAMGVSLGTAGVGGYIDLRLEDNTINKDLESITGRITTVATSVHDRITLVANEVNDNGDSIDSNEEAIEEIQRILIQRQGDQDLKLQRLQSDIDKQDLKLDQLLIILQDLRGN